MCVRGPRERRIVSRFARVRHRLKSCRSRSILRSVSSLAVSSPGEDHDLAFLTGSLERLLTDAPGGQEEVFQLLVDHIGRDGQYGYEQTDMASFATTTPRSAPQGAL